MTRNDDAGAAQLLAADVVRLEDSTEKLAHELAIAKLMLSEALTIAHLAIAQLARTR